MMGKIELSREEIEKTLSEKYGIEFKLSDIYWNESDTERKWVGGYQKPEFHFDLKEQDEG